LGPFAYVLHDIPLVLLITDYFSDIDLIDLFGLQKLSGIVQIYFTVNIYIKEIGVDVGILFHPVQDIRCL